MQKKTRVKTDERGAPVKVIDIKIEYEEELEMFDRRKYKSDYDKYQQRLQAVRDMEAESGQGGGGAYAMTRRDQRAFDYDNSIGRAKQDSEGNYLRADGKKATSSSELRGIQPLRKNERGQFVGEDNQPVSDGDSLALASDYPYPG